MENILRQIYGDKITIQNSGNTTRIEYDVKNKLYSYDIAVCINDPKRIAVIWSLKLHRSCKGRSYLTAKEKWEEIQLPKDELQYTYKRFKTDNGMCYEKVLIVSLEILSSIKYDLYDYLKFDVDDDIPLGLIREKDNSLYEWHDEKERERKSTSTWKRNQMFRKVVLENYNKTCAVCGCNVEQILEAAHIIPVADGGKDDVDNGICLCRNHHKMYDEKMFKIDFKTHLIYDVSNVAEKYLDANRKIARSNKEKSKESKQCQY